MLLSRKLSLSLAVAALSALGTAFPTGAQAQTTTSIGVVNNGFEFPQIGAGNTTGNTPYGFTFNGGNNNQSGTYETGLQAGNIPGRTGNQYGFTNAGGSTLEQIIQNGFTTTVGDTYTLTVDANTSSNANATISLTNGLFGGNQVIFSTSGATSATKFTTFTTSFVATTASSLGFVLRKTGGDQANFDNIQLTQFDPTVVAAPEPAAWVGLVVGAMGLGALSLRARRRSLA